MRVKHFESAVNIFEENILKNVIKLKSVKMI